MSQIYCDICNRRYKNFYSQIQRKCENKIKMSCYFLINDVIFDNERIEYLPSTVYSDLIEISELKSENDKSAISFIFIIEFFLQFKKLGCKNTRYIWVLNDFLNKKDSCLFNHKSLKEMLFQRDPEMQDYLEPLIKKTFTFVLSDYEKKGINLLNKPIYSTLLDLNSSIEDLNLHMKKIELTNNE